MNEQEQLDLSEPNKKCDSIRKNAFFGMRDCLRMSAEELKHSGSKTNEAATISMYKNCEAEIQKLTKEHLKKYPD